MMKKGKMKLTLDQLATYQIKVPGELDKYWQELAGAMIVTIESDSTGLPTTTLTDTLDQAALQGLLRRLYSLGLPLISVICVDEN